MEADEIEAEAALLYERAGADPSYPPMAWALARRVGFDVAFVCQSLPALALDTATGPAIRLRRGLSSVAAHWLAAHEIAEHTWARRRIRPWGDPERLSNRLAASIVAPVAAMRRVVGEAGPCPIAVAAALKVSAKTAALRMGELAMAAVVIFDGLWVARRGPFEWPPDWELRRALAAGELPSGVRVYEPKQGLIVLVAPLD